jgi:hypothetical protein
LREHPLDACIPARNVRSATLLALPLVPDLVILVMMFVMMMRVMSRAVMMIRPGRSRRRERDDCQ